MIHFNTTNKSFIQMHFYLKNKGIQNNTFFLTLIDRSLEFVDPHDPNLTLEQKARVLNECMRNYWYYLREIVKVQTPGGAVKYNLNPAVLAFHFLSELNINIYLELPRQIGKTTAVLVRKLYTYNFRSKNSKIAFFHQDHSGSKNNLSELKKIRDDLPVYLRMETSISENGKKLKARSRAESIQHVKNGNTIITMPGASSPEKADKIGRGITVTEIFYDEHAFIKYNNIIYATITPAYLTASKICRESGNPYGIVITTTAGSRNRDYAEYSYQFKESATPWNEGFYDMNVGDIYNVINSNPKSTFVYIKYQYYEIGFGRDWFENIVKTIGNDWKKIRREYLLEWEFENNNSPFDSADIEILLSNKKDAIRQLYFGAHVVNIYEEFDQEYFMEYPPIIGIDVSSTQARNDSSCITIIDSLSTKVIATFNSNFVSGKEFSYIIISLVKNYYPTAVVNIETNGGYADIIIEECKKYIRSNLYFEIVEKTIEERSSNYNSGPIRKSVKRFGLNSTKQIRNKLIDILYNRVEYHKDKFICPILINEISTMEVKKNSKVEHSDGNHDDQVFSYLIALYVWYHGKSISSFGIKKYNLKTDDFSDNNDEEYEIDDNIKKSNDISPEIMSGLFGQFGDVKINNQQEASIDNNKSFINTNVNIPDYYKQNNGSVYTLENHLIHNKLNGDNNENDNLFSSIFGNLNNNNSQIKNFWE